MPEQNRLIANEAERLPPFRLNKHLNIFAMLPAFASAAALLLGVAAQAAPPRPAVQMRIEGEVFHDVDGNGSRGAAEPGIEGVAVSDGVSIVETDSDGWYALDAAFPQSGGECMIFITKPAGWRIAGSFFRSVSAAEKPEFVDFALIPAGEEPEDDFTFIHCSDPHVSDAETGGPVRSSPAVSGNMLFVAGLDGNVCAFVGADAEP